MKNLPPCPRCKGKNISTGTTLTGGFYPKGHRQATCLDCFLHTTTYPTIWEAETAWTEMTTKTKKEATP